MDTIHAGMNGCYTRLHAPSPYTHTHLHVLLHSGNIHLICELQLVVVAGVRQHQVIVLATPHQPMCVTCSLERRGGRGVVDRRRKGLTKGS